MQFIKVLMSTYNGEKYLKVQLDSILKQKNVKVDVLVRDDGSNDNTLNILKEYAENNNIKIFKENNIGCKKSFLKLLKEANDSEYYAFSDQDDYWEEQKLCNAINLLENYDSNLPLLYFSNKKLVDKNLNMLKYQMDHKFVLNFSEILFTNNGSGCTMVFNKKLKDIINTVDTLSLNNIPFHDHWLYIICLGIGGKVIFDPNAFIKYRQHENNVIGAKRENRIYKLTKLIFKKMINFINKIICKIIGKQFVLIENKNTIYNYSLELFNAYKEHLTSDSVEFLELVQNYPLSIKNKFKLIKALNLRLSLLRKLLIYRAIFKNRL